MCFEVSRLLEAVLAEVALSFDGSLTARSSSCHGLAVEGIGDVASGIDPRDTSARRSAFGLDVADLIDVDILSEEFGVGVVTDGEEEAIDREIYTLFIGAEITPP